MQVEDSIIFQVLSSKILQENHLILCKSGKNLYFGRDKILHRDEERLRLKEVDVSRTHAFVAWEEGAFTFKDLNSSFGSFLNGNKVTKVILRNQDLLQIGSTILKIHRHATCPDCSLSLHPVYNLEPPRTPESEPSKFKPKPKPVSKKRKLIPIPKPKIPKPVHGDKDIPSVPARKEYPFTRSSRLPISISKSKPIHSSNKGHSMLQKLGWNPGDSLGSGPQITEPINPKFTLGKRGIGSKK